MAALIRLFNEQPGGGAQRGVAHQWRLSLNSSVSAAAQLAAPGGWRLALSSLGVLAATIGSLYPENGGSISIALRGAMKKQTEMAKISVA